MKINFLLLNHCALFNNEERIMIVVTATLEVWISTKYPGYGISRWHTVIPFHQLEVDSWISGNILIKQYAMWRTLQIFLFQINNFNSTFSFNFQSWNGHLFFIWLKNKFLFNSKTKNYSIWQLYNKKKKRARYLEIWYLNFMVQNLILSFHRFIFRKDDCNLCFMIIDKKKRTFFLHRIEFKRQYTSTSSGTNDQM